MWISKSRLFAGVLAAALVVGGAGCSRPSAGGGAAAGGGGGATGSIQVKGSDTMVNLANRWAEAFMGANPRVNVAVTGGGSGTGIAALLNGTTDVANASREIKDEEKADAGKAGVTPVETKVAIDGLAVAVNKGNKVDELTFEQLSGIFSGAITDWTEVGGDAGRIVVLSRESNSGTHVYFLEEIVQYDGDTKRTYASSALLMPSSQAIVDEIARNPKAIGYFGMGYLTDGIKDVKVAKEEGSEAVAPTARDVQSGTYPISRGLFVYTNGEPADTVKAYVDFVLSEEGQGIVEEMDFVPLGR